MNKVTSQIMKKLTNRQQLDQIIKNLRSALRAAPAQRDTAINFESLMNNETPRGRQTT